MTASRKVNAPIKSIRGIVSFDEHSRGLSLITPDGVRLEIARNRNGRFLANWIFHSVKVIGRVVRKPHRTILQCLYFEPDQLPPEFGAAA